MEARSSKASKISSIILREEADWLATKEILESN